jgi:hypothetical protein
MNYKLKWIAGAVVLTLLMVSILYAYSGGPDVYVNPIKIVNPTDVPTGVPAFQVDQKGLGLLQTWTKDGGTPVASLTKGGVMSLGSTVNSGSISGNITVSGGITTTALNVNGTTSSTTIATTGNISATGGMQAGTWLLLTPATRITVTQDSTINPTGSYQPLGAAGATSTATITAKPAGSFLRLINETNQTITISDTGTLKLSADIALGQFDTLTLISDGTNWVQISTANN